MTISAKDWAMYVARLSRLGKTAESMMKEYIAEHGSEDIKDITEFAFGLVTKYGEGAASLACEMYEALAKVQGAKVPAASPAYTARFWETKVAMKGTTDAEKPAAVSRLVKRAGADTTMQNAIRDGAQFAWIPSGDSCPFCIALASRGWQYASKKSLKNGHAEHIHANCDCQYVVRFDKESTVQGYDPEKYQEMYYSAEGSTPQEKINSMRRQLAADAKTEYRGAPKNWMRFDANDDVDMSFINPKYNPYLRPGVNTKEQMGYNWNCVNSVACYELRARGYDVTALPYYKCDLRRKAREVWIDIKETIFESASKQDIVQYFEKAKEGWRYFVGYSLDNDGHAIIAKIKNNTLVFLDPQANMVYSKDEVIKRLEGKKISIWRIDDREFSQTGFNSCEGR